MLENINDYDTIILGFGAHTVKNRCIEQLIPLFDTGKIDAIVTNGASVVHDTEIGFNDDTSEDVEATIKEGKFGWDRDVIWELNGFIKQCRTTSLGMMVAVLSVGRDNTEISPSSGTVIKTTYSLLYQSVSVTTFFKCIKTLM